jgi:hypothetical protein
MLHRQVYNGYIISRVLRLHRQHKNSDTNIYFLSMSYSFRKKMKFISL